MFVGIYSLSMHLPLTTEHWEMMALVIWIQTSENAKL